MKSELIIKIKTLLKVKKLLRAFLLFVLLQFLFIGVIMAVINNFFVF